MSAPGRRRAFVLVPLAEIAPHAVDPHSGLTAAQLLADLPGCPILRAPQSHAPRVGTHEPIASSVVPIQSPLWPTQWNKVSNEAGVPAAFPHTHPTP